MLTKLEIVNEAIKAVGLAPVASVDSKHPAFLDALSTFNYQNKEVQKQGWWFNDHTKVLTPGTDKTIVVPQYATSVSARGYPEIVMRGNRLYDVKRATYEFGHPVKARIVEVLPIEFVPETMKFYIAARTKYAHYVNNDGQDPKLTVYGEELQLAHALAKGEDLKFRQVNQQDGLTYAQKKWPYSRVAKVR